MTDSKPSTKSVTLHLPSDIIAAIARLSRELEQPQSEILVAALRRGLEYLELQAAPSSELEQLADRVAALEALPAQVAELAAQVDRLLNASLERSALPEPQDNLSPVAESIPVAKSVPVAESPVLPEQCPRCSHKLSAPLKASGRQVCIKCGWTNKPRSARPAASSDLPPDELKRLLDQAAADAIANMKPKKPEPPSNSKFPPFRGR